MPAYGAATTTLITLSPVHRNLNLDVEAVIQPAVILEEKFAEATDNHVVTGHFRNRMAVSHTPHNPLVTPPHPSPRRNLRRLRPDVARPLQVRRADGVILAPCALIDCHVADVIGGLFHEFPDLIRGEMARAADFASPCDKLIFNLNLDSIPLY